MTFEQALTAMKAGRKAKRPDWRGWYAMTDLEASCVEFKDIIATDWIIVEYPQPEPTIEDLRRAIVALAEDAKVARGLLNETLIHTERLRRPTDQ